MAAHQAPLSMGFSRQEHWSGLPFPSPMHESEKWKWSRSVMSDSSRPHGLQPTRLLHPWDFPGKSTGVGCHCFLHSLALGWSYEDCATLMFMLSLCSDLNWNIHNTWASQVALVVKNLLDSAGDARDVGLLPEPGRSPSGGHGHPLEYSCLENSMDRGAWQSIVYGVARSWTWLID